MNLSVWCHISQSEKSNDVLYAPSKALQKLLASSRLSSILMCISLVFWRR